jgi:hypothetical protein
VDLPAIGRELAIEHQLVVVRQGHLRLTRDLRQRSDVPHHQPLVAGGDGAPGDQGLPPAHGGVGVEAEHLGGCGFPLDLGHPEFMSSITRLTATALALTALAPADRFLARLRADDPTRPIGDALLDQRTIAGIGNLWKCEGCFDAGIDPWRPTGDVSDDEALRVVRLTRPRMQQSARKGYQVRGPAIYGHVGRPCPRCGAKIRARGQGDDNRTTYWCPGCQH